MSGTATGARLARRALLLLLSVGTALAAGLATAPAAAAHPLGNATVNHYDGLDLYPDHVTDIAVEDVAEIPTLQRKPLIDSDGNGRLSTAELTRYGDRQCASLSAAVSIGVGHDDVRLRVSSSTYGERPGAIGLSIGRLVCRLTASADLTRSATVRIDDEWDGAGIGWHELIAVGHGVSLRNSPIPARSISDALLHYPNDLLSSPLDQRSATIAVFPGAGASTYAGGHNVPTAGPVTRLLGTLATTFDGLVGRRHLTLGVGLLAVLLAMVLGAGHAFLPGHGKTIMAAYLVGKRGRFRDVLTVGATVTVTHTAGVLAIGLVLSVSATLAPTVVEQDLAVLSGLIVAGVGLWLLISAVRHRSRATTVGDELAVLATVDGPAPAHVQPTVSAAKPAYAGAAALTLPSTGVMEGGHPAHPGHRHARSGPLHHHHDHQHGGSTAAGPADASTGGFSKKGLVGLGVAGGLVPSPSALLVLLAAVALGRTAFGIVLVLGYGVGMALALTAAGLLLLRLRGRLGRIAGDLRLRRLSGLLRALPVLTACLVLVVGIGLALQALAGTV
jgi:nickel/cobalt transporter (NicO) family protein